MTDAVARSFAARTARATLDALRARRLRVDIAIVSPAESARLNRGFRGKGRPADVLSFPTPGGRPGGTVGTVVLTPALIRRRARRIGRSTRSWFRELSVHGTLHCLGFHHDEAEAAARMFAVQRALTGRQPG